MLVDPEYLRSLPGSPASELVDALLAEYGREDAHRVLDAILDQVPNHELAAAAYDFRGFWARPKQRIDTHAPWKSYGYLTGRGTGKTTTLAAFIVEEFEQGRAKCLGMAAQNEEKTIAVQVKGLIDAAPPWYRPEWKPSENALYFPNGAVALAFTPEAPEAIRAPNFDLVWVSEIQSWPAATRDAALMNFLFALRVGYARLLWDATPKRGHPILKRFLAESAQRPEENVVVRGSMLENYRNLSPNVIERLLRKFDGTRAGREELYGEMLEDSENATAKQEWIDKNRRRLPERLARQAIAVDPAVTERQGSDRTGIVRAGLDADGQALVISDKTGKHSPSAWAEIVIGDYVQHKVDVVVVETNKGGSLLTQNLRAAAASRGLRVVVAGKEEKPTHTKGVLYVKEVYSKGSKKDRAQPVSTAYERGRVSHAIGSDLGSLEETLTTWEADPNERSPDDLDALVAALVELLELTNEKGDARAGFKGLAEAAQQLLQPAASRPFNVPIVPGGAWRPRGI